MKIRPQQSSNPAAILEGKFLSARLSAPAIGLILLASANRNVFGAMTTVSALNPTPPPPGVIDSPANVGNADFLTLSTATSAVATAFTNNTGGVIDWEPANGWVANAQNASSQTVSYGISQNGFLTITRTDSGNTFGPTTGGGTPTTSAVNYLGFSGSASPITLTFSQGLADWGMTELNRFASRTVTFSFTLADNTTINYAPQTQDPLANNSDANNWYGFQAPANNPLVQVSFTANGFVRFDDMAFIVSSVPEPTSLGLFGIGVLALAAYRRPFRRA
jgi:hypothetical protein